MKKTIIILAILLSMFVTCSGQMYAGLGAGLSITKAVPAAQLQVGYEYRKIVAQVGYHTHLDRKNPAVFNIRVGKRFQINEDASIYATAGYGSELTSVDKVGGSRNVFVFGAEYFRLFSYSGGWFVEATGSGRYVFATFGVKYIF
jgi:hypothetical protein